MAGYPIPAVSCRLRLGNPGGDVDPLIPSAPCVRGLVDHPPRLAAWPRGVDEIHLPALRRRSSGSANHIVPSKLPGLEGQGENGGAARLRLIGWRTHRRGLVPAKLAKRHGLCAFRI